MTVRIPKALILLALLFMATACSKDKSVCAGKQSEAQANLIGIATHQEQYRERHGQFADKLSDLPGFRHEPWRPSEKGLNYDLRVTRATKTIFEAQAVGRAGSEMEGDRWVVDASGKPRALEDICR